MPPPEEDGETYLEQWEGSQETNFQLLTVCHAVFLGADEVEENLGELV